MPYKRGNKLSRPYFVFEDFRVLLAEKLSPCILSIFETQMSRMEEIKKEIESYRKKKELHKKEMLNYIEVLIHTYLEFNN